MAIEPLRVAVVSSSQAVREGIAALLEDACGVACVGAAATMTQLGRLMPVPDAVIIDAEEIESPGALSHRNAPAMPLVMLVDEPDREWGLRMLSLGSVAMLERNPSSEQLAVAIRAAASGLTVLSPAHVADFMGVTAHMDGPRSEEWIQPLTPRELQILKMLCDGMPNKSIALELQISEHTAKFHVGQILAKLGAESRTEAVTIGIRRGLVMV